MVDLSPLRDARRWTLSVKAVIRDDAGRCLLVRRSNKCKNFVGASSFEMPSARVVLLCMEGRFVGGELRISEEHDDAAWVPVGELPDWTVVEPMKPVIQNLLNPTKTHARQATHPAV